MTRSSWPGRWRRGHGCGLLGCVVDRTRHVQGIHHTGQSTALEVLVDARRQRGHPAAMPVFAGEFLSLQAGVIARRQLVSRGWADHDIARMLRRRLWASVFDGVYVDHTGELSWLQRAWAGVLFSWPSALSHASALTVADGPGRRSADDDKVHIVVERDRRLVRPPGIELHRRGAFDKHVQWNLGPPRVRYEQAAIAVATSADSEYAAVAALSQAVQSRRTTARRMLSAMEERERLARRKWVAGVLRDIDEGTCSVLEHGYLTRVERPHHLPRGRRQLAGVGKTGRIYRDVAYHLAARGRARRAAVPWLDRCPRPGLRSRSARPGRRPAHDPARLGSGLRPTLLDGRAGRRTPAGARMGWRNQAMRSGLRVTRLIAGAK